ncbi:MAG TPA: S8 family serine peptidase [Verrucomicrobiae bacterium]|nr:S8 family serine peptidase [Verrucomicrobiae bacterium]
MLRLSVDNRALCVFAVFILAAIALISSAPAAEQASFRADRVLIVPKANKASQTAALHRKKGRHVAKRFPAFKNLEVVNLPAGQDVLATVQEYLDSGLVEVAEPDFLYHIATTPDEQTYADGKLWHLNGAVGSIEAPAAWETRHDASGVVVAVLDTGVLMTHEDLAANLWTNTKEIPDNGIDDDGNGYIDDVHGINSITGKGDPTDDDRHGTHVAGIIGAVGNNGKGVAGVAWNVQLMPLKFISSSGDGSNGDAVECINYAIQNGAHIINASFGAPNASSTLQIAITAARAAGIIIVAAAGNETANNDLTPSYPANYALDNIISVAATGATDQIEFYSNFGATSVDLAAPGAAILSTGNLNDTNYSPLSGTSMAAPIVSGVVALLKAQFPNDSPAQIRERLLATVDPLPSLAGKCVSGGRVNLRKAFLPYVTAAFTPSTLAGAFPLTVQFTNQSVGEVASYRWDFGDGSPVSTEANPNHVFKVDGNFTVTLTATAPSGAISTTARQIGVEANYNLKSATYEWINPTAMTRFTLGDNGVSGAQELPFPFYFFGQPKTQLYIGANGLLGFDPLNMSTITISDIPTSASPNGVILPYWDNLNPASGGAIYAGVVGQEPNRRYVVSWIGVPRNTSSSDKMTFQAVLNETSSRIQFNYLDVNPASIRGGGSQATIGLEAPSGAAAAKYAFKGLPSRVENQQSILFTPTGRISVRFDAPTMASGVFYLTIPGETGQTFVIEGSANLTEWTEVHRRTIDVSGIIPFADINAAQGNRFFRARLLP